MPLANTHEVVGKLMDVLFTVEETRVSARLVDMIQRNSTLADPSQHQNLHLGFRYGGKCFSQVPHVRGQVINAPLHHSLVEECEDYIKDAAQVSADRKLVSQMMVPLLHPCSSQQDVRDALPEGLVRLVPEYRAMDRVKEEGWTLLADLRLANQFRRIKDKISLYTVTRLLY